MLPVVLEADLELLERSVGSLESLHTVTAEIVRRMLQIEARLYQRVHRRIDRGMTLVEKPSCQRISDARSREAAASRDRSCCRRN